MSKFNATLTQRTSGYHLYAEEILELSVEIGGEVLRSGRKLNTCYMSFVDRERIKEEIVRELTHMIGEIVAREIYKELEDAGKAKIKHPVLLAIKEAK